MTYEKARQKKIEELAERNLQKQQEQLAAEAQLNKILNTFLTDEARQRLSNVRLVKKELFENAISTIVYLAQAQRIQEKLTDEEIKALLEKLREKKEIKIRRK